MLTGIPEEDKEEMAVDLLKMISDHDHQKQEWGTIISHNRIPQFQSCHMPKYKPSLIPQPPQKKKYKILRKKSKINQSHLLQKYSQHNNTNQIYKTFSLNKLQSQKSYPQLNTHPHLHLNLNTMQTHTTTSINNKTIHQGQGQEFGYLSKIKLENVKNFSMIKPKKNIYGESVPTIRKIVNSNPCILKISKIAAPQDKDPRKECKADGRNQGRTEGKYQGRGWHTKDDDINRRVKQDINFKSKVRLKIGKKFINKQQSSDISIKSKFSFIYQDSNHLHTSKRAQINFDNYMGKQQSKTRKTLRGVLDSNRYRNRRSVACLLRSLFDSQAHYHHVDRTNDFAIKSARYSPDITGQHKFRDL